MIRLEPVLTEWRALMGYEAVLDADAAQRRYGADCSGTTRSMAGAVLVSSAGQLPEVMRIAARHHAALHPLSTGKNWGYGTALAPCDGVTILDLSRLDQIVDFDPELGTVTVEPGVTQEQLNLFLEEKYRAGCPRFMVPTTGAGPDCSLMGNALERGFGLTPIADHSSAITDLCAVLPDGSAYRSAMSEVAGNALAKLSRWGIGPHFNGLFAQSCVGVVTRMTLVLARQPECVKVVLFSLKNDALLEPAAAAVRRILSELPSTVGGINLMNRQRVLAMTAPYPSDAVTPGQTMSAELLARLSSRYLIMPWTGLGSLYGRKNVVQAAQQVIRQELSGIASRLMFVSVESARRISSVASVFPGSLGKRLRRLSKTLSQGVAMIQGEPGRAAFPLAYWRMPPVGDVQLQEDPSRDGAGLIWYAPLVPMRPALVRRVADDFVKTAAKHGVEPLITFTSLNDRLFDCTMPILFDPKQAGSTDRARACHRELIDVGAALGAFPYRIDVDTMAWLRERAPITSSLVERLTAALGGCQLSPGRYFSADMPIANPAGIPEGEHAPIPSV